MDYVSTIISNLRLEHTVEELESSMNTIPDKRDPDWPHMWCRLSRLIHIAIWDECPEPKYTQKIIEILTEVTNQLCALDTRGYDQDEKQRIKRHLRNIKLRIKNLKDNYTQGKPSDFAPDDKLDY